MQRGRENKPHIGIYGRRNTGKSSLINTVAGQDIAIVSHRPGTTTDPVKKSFEIEGVGPAILIDTAGIDDTGDLGKKRTDRTLLSIDQIDMALLCVSDNKWGIYEENLTELLEGRNIPYLVVFTRSDILRPTAEFSKKVRLRTGRDILLFSSVTTEGYDELLGKVKEVMPENIYSIPSLLGDIISTGDIILLIAPQDTEAPEGRLILPQVQAVRDILDNDAVAVVVKEKEIGTFLGKTAVKPALAITDSQIFDKADAAVPEEIPLTSFSIALARMKGDFSHYLEGTPVISQLKDGDRVLILESCSHHVTCDDIGRVKIPGWIREYTGRKLKFDTGAGTGTINRPVTDYSLVIQCGACMITRRQLHNRLRPAISAGIPVTNYGMAIAWVKGAYSRAIAPFITGK